MNADESSNADSPRNVEQPDSAATSPASSCSPLGRLGQDRLDDLLSYLPTIEGKIAAQAESAEEINDADGEDVGVHLTLIDAFWVLNCLGFVKTIPTHLKANSKAMPPEA